jgi:hypothetical protein
MDKLHVEMVEVIKNLKTAGFHRANMVDLILKDIIGDIAPIKVKLN